VVLALRAGADPATGGLCCLFCALCDLTQSRAATLPLVTPAIFSRARGLDPSSWGNQALNPVRAEPYTSPPQLCSRR
jgi:hypothetical protein